MKNRNTHRFASIVGLVLMAILLLVAACSTSTPVATTPVATAPAATTPAPTPTQVFTLKYSDHGPPTGTYAAEVIWKLDEIERRSGGRVKIERFWGGALLTVKEVLAGTGSGVTNMGLASATVNPAQLPLLGHPGLFLRGYKPTELQALFRKTLDKFPEMTDELTKQNVVMWSNIFVSTMQMVSKKPVRTLEDYKGLKIRGSGGYAPAFFKPVGAVGVAIQTDEQYTALDRGTIDATEASMEMMTRYRLYEVAKYLLLVNRAATAYQVFIINKDSFNRLPKDIQDIIMEVGREGEIRWAKKLEEGDAKEMEELVKRGMETIQFPQADMERWANMPEVKKVPSDWVDKQVAAGYSRERLEALLAFYLKGP